MIPPLLTHWRTALPIFAAVAFMGAIWTANHYRHAYQTEHALRQADLTSYARAQTEAQAKAFEARQREQANFDRKAKVSDEKHELQLASLGALADSYKRDHRMFAEAATGSRSGPTSTGAGDGPGVHTDPASPAIVVAESDFDLCTAWVAYGVGAHDWAVGLSAP